MELEKLGSVSECPEMNGSEVPRVTVLLAVNINTSQVDCNYVLIVFLRIERVKVGKIVSQTI